jgi:hypothetical protein
LHLAFGGCQSKALPKKTAIGLFQLYCLMLNILLLLVAVAVADLERAERVDIERQPDFQ